MKAVYNQVYSPAMAAGRVGRDARFGREEKRRRAPG